MFRLDSDDVFRAETLTVCRGSSTDSGLGLSHLAVAEYHRLATAKQIHSDRVLLVESPGPQGEGDAMISNVPGIALWRSEPPIVSRS